MNYQEERLILQGYKKAYRDIVNSFEEYSDFLSYHRGFSKKNMLVILKAMRDNAVWLFENGVSNGMPFLVVTEDKKFKQIEIGSFRPRKETKE